MIKLHWHPFSIVPWRVRIALHEKKLVYEDVTTDLYSTGPSCEFLSYNPFGQIPVLEHDGFILSESMAILEFLEEKYPDPALTPSDIEDRALMRMFMCWGTDYWPPAWKKWMAPRLPERLADDWTDDTVEEGRQEIASHLDVLENRLSDRRWLVAEYSLADICYAPFVLVLKSVDLEAEVVGRANVKRWIDQLLERDAIRDTMMPNIGY